ncbi:RluA family pseudouridine synthase [Pelagibacterium xiamenense]|uniref:RluA family pseudouridine synthase n=1 Tax=Pelagibacterium xiamenense TaxID=2901140 RepID=UPI001E61A4F2|nr:RluA family pseudouridine synthase [Pelagibacterium xiamenense]MCD7060423.1 RluA family pseudouridine synthase [Pelagibacterium xiamenense]
MNDPQIEGHGATVAEEDTGTRLDAFLAARFPAFSRNRIKDLILSGAVTVDGAANATPKYRVKAGESITLAAPEPVEAEPEPQQIALDILYEDDDLIVINKPAGMVVHPAPGNENGTLVNALIHHCGESLRGIGGVKRPGIVHRLDKDTSGVMVAAKTDAAHNGLAAQFADHGRSGPLERAYTAFVWGVPNPLKSTIETRIGRDPHNRLKQSVNPRDGREAITHYATAQRFGEDNWSVGQVTCELETGRTHQIRVHMAHIGHPLLGDTLYGAGFATKINKLPPEPATALRALGRQALHAAVLGFAHPVSGKTLRFSTDLPQDMHELATMLSPYALQ